MLKNNYLNMDKLESKAVDKYFKFRENRYQSRQIVVLPTKMKTKNLYLETSIKVWPSAIYPRSQYNGIMGHIHTSKRRQGFDEH